MKLYSSIGPNPRLVRLFAAAKGVELPVEHVDILAGENRQPAFLKLNATGTTPVLELRDGRTIAETTAICEYLEELFPATPLIGASAEERAHTRMWWRRVDQAVVQPMTAGFRGAEGFELFKNRVRCYPSVAGEFKQAAREGLAWLEAQLDDRSDWLCGERLSVADLLLFVFIEFGEQVGQELDRGHARLQQWLQRMRALECVAA
ncbi:Glutathione S-transferase GST-6.0 [compost metagenome]